MELDETDREILDILKNTGRISYTEIGDELGISDVAAKKRISKLQEEGVIENFTVNLDYSKLGKSLHGFLLVKISPEIKEKTREKLQGNEKVLRFYNTIGEYDLIIETACKDLDEVKEFTEREIGNLKGVQEIRTAIVTGQ